MDDDEAFPRLGERDVALFGELGQRREVVAGEYLYRQGDRDDDFFVVVSAELDIVVQVDEGEQVAVGDVRSGSTKRVAAAVGEGSSAVHSVHQYLSFTD